MKFKVGDKVRYIKALPKSKAFFEIDDICEIRDIYKNSFLILSEKGCQDGAEELVLNNLYNITKISNKGLIQVNKFEDWYRPTAFELWWRDVNESNYFSYISIISP